MQSGTRNLLFLLLGFCLAVPAAVYLLQGPLSGTALFRPGGANDPTLQAANGGHQAGTGTELAAAGLGNNQALHPLPGSSIDDMNASDNGGFQDILTASEATAAGSGSNNNALQTQETNAPAPDSIAGITAALQEVDPFIDGLADLEPQSEAQDIATAESSPIAAVIASIPVVDLSTLAGPEAEDTEAVDANAFKLLGTAVRSGTSKQLTWQASETYSGASIPTPVLVVHGAEKGPVLCLTAGVHGDELNGIETVRRVVHNTKPEKLKGTLVAVPIVNIQGFQRQSRYLPDRRDLNRFFPGHPGGSSASRIAHGFFKSVMTKCDALVDLHTGSFHRTNLPQLRANLYNDDVVGLSQNFGSTVVLHSEGGIGTLRRAAVEAGIPAVTLEAGEPLRLQEDKVAHSVRGINTLLASMKMYKRRNIWGDSEAVYYTSQWVRADTGGILFSAVGLGKSVLKDELLGTVTDPVSNEREEIRAPYPGRVIGMALNQFVMPGFATFHMGLEADDLKEATLDDDPTILSHDVAYEPDISSEKAEPTEE